MLDDWFKPPPALAPVTRTPAAQQAVDAETASLVLYHYDGCMYCARVRRALQALALDLELRDVMRNPAYRAELVAGGGRSTVPCLRIEADGGAVQWMYESAEIIRYLEQRFGARG